MTFNRHGRMSTLADTVPLALVALGLLVASPLVAQTESSDTVPAYRLEGVTVTTTRSAVDRSVISQKVNVLTAADLGRTAATTVAEALRANTPIDVIEYPGLLTGISIRGFRPQYSGINHRTLLLVDGRPAGTSNLALLHLTGVQQIEVLRGPGAAFFGSNAMGGVVNVVSQRSNGPVAGSATLGYGSYGAYESDLSIGGSLGSAVDFDVALATVGQRDGYSTGSRRSLSSGPLPKTLPDGSIVRLPWTTADTVLDFSEYGSMSGRLRAGYAANDRWRVDMTAEAYRGEDVQNPGDLNADWDGRTIKDVGRRSLELNITGALDSATPSIRLYSALETVDYYDSPESPRFVNFRTPTRTSGGQLQDVIRLGDHEVTIGADYTAAEAKSEAYSAAGVAGAPFSPNSAIHSAAGFAQTRLSLLNRRLIVTGGARLDRIAFHVRDTPNLAGHPANSERHLVFTPNLGARASITPAVQLYGNLGRAFVTPDAFNVAGYSERRAGDRDAVFVTRGNADLEPETSRSWDTGISVRGPGDRSFELDIAYFHTYVRDRIIPRTDPVADGGLTAGGDSILSITTYVNVDEAGIRGIEAEASYDIGELLGAQAQLRAFLTGTRILRAEERFAATGTVQRIRNVADLTVLAGLDFDDGERFSGRLSARYVGERVDSDYVAWWEPGEILYPEYLVMDLTGSVRIADRYRVGIELRNLADEDYFEVRGYNLPGRSLGVSVGVDF